MSMATAPHRSVAQTGARDVALRSGVAPQHVEWHGMALTVPADWEIARHGLSPELGSLCFVDRRRQRLALSWATIENTPDWSRLLQEMAADAPRPGARREFELEAWRGIVLETPHGVETRAVAHHASTSRLLELRIWSRPGETALGADIMSSFRARSSAEGTRRFRAFGLDVITARDFVLTSAKVVPCDVTLCFERARARKLPLLRFSARRLGMAASWFRGDFAQLHAAKAEGVEHGPLETVRLDGREAHVSRGRCVEKRWVRLLGRGREERALLWSAPEENAIYLLRSEGPLRGAVDPRQFMPASGALGEGPDEAE